MTGKVLRIELKGWDGILLKVSIPGVSLLKGCCFEVRSGYEVKNCSVVEIKK